MAAKMRNRWLAWLKGNRFPSWLAILPGLLLALLWIWKSLLLWPFRLEQRILVVVSQSNSWQGRLSCWERVLPGGGWKRDGEVIPVLLGRNGVAWGSGLHPPQSGLQKEEGDGRTPAGCFRLGLILGIAPSLPAGAKWRLYHQKSPQDAWIENPELPQYNHLVTISNGADLPDWFEGERLHIEDPVLEWMVFVEHNYPVSHPGGGSAIFLHGRYGERAATSGCLALEKKNLLSLIQWLDPRGDPELVVLTENDYRRLWQSWALPSPTRIGLASSP
ncbi:hypothetical protein MAMT_00451 [Methylacidimicrobium tartarophylax]|uniref:L,D-TPase catalytic domain-containing protein n=2 Tax=Methylacidimicrobium tartarophylax TaxID=1041768 RepID=A0A5E6M9Q3_9BACT|nr:hypothetical protein MAMT_00451 [Methylacidimicrobium tartarophylax]